MCWSAIPTPAPSSPQLSLLPFIFLPHPFPPLAPSIHPSAQLEASIRKHKDTLVLFVSATFSSINTTRERHQQYRHIHRPPGAKHPLSDRPNKLRTQKENHSLAGEWMEWGQEAACYYKGYWGRNFLFQMVKTKSKRIQNKKSNRWLGGELDPKSESMCIC